MNELKIFESEFGRVRVVDLNGEVNFVAKDVCEILDISKYRDAVARLDEDERGSVLVDTLGGKQEMASVNEYGLYSLILKSRKKEAKKFQRWVTHEVLPSIRKTGQYKVGQESYQIEDPIERAKKWIEEYQERLMLQQQVSEFKPKADYVDKILKAKGAVNISQIASDYGLSAYALNQILHSDQVQYKLGNQWLLYAKHRDKGYTKSDTHNYLKDDGTGGISLHTKWTQKGRLFIHEILTKRNISPIEV